jgi:hypothetical protein
LFVISPGRFFAANEVKVLLANLVVTYDMKFEEGKGVPHDLCIARASDVIIKTRTVGVG